VTRHLTLLAALAGAAVLSGCLGDDGEPADTQPIRGHVLHLYASRPTEGPSAETSRAMAAGQRQALADANGRAGRYDVRLISLSASKPGSGNWDPGQVAENADAAAKDPRAIAYLGELNLGASAVSVPVTNKAGILQVSPADGLASLTEAPPRSAAGPERYFPTGRRSFLRLVPDDLVEAHLIVDRLVALGVERPALIVGTGVYARELAAEVAADARDAGIAPVAAKDLRDDPDTVLKAPGELADAPPDAQPDGVVLALARDRYTAQLLAGLRRELPQARLITGDGVLVAQPLAPAAGSEPVQLEAIAPQPPRGAGAAPGVRVLHRIARDQSPELATLPALWGYESVRVALDAIRSAQRDGGPATRADVIQAALRRRVRHSSIGTYEVRRNGAVEGLPVALYRLQGDRFEYLRTLL
jgi:branched-chain amino acid transport system substrate-binding protein